MSRLTLQIELLEDLHIGTGTGHGDVDALQVRDRHNQPVLPASHIKGLLREAANEWYRLDPSSIDREDILTLFGRPGSGQGRLQLTSAYLKEGTSAKTILWGSTRISEKGTAQEGSLRFVEYIPAGCIFRMEAMVVDGDPDQLDLVKAIMSRCSRMGGGRNRGYGKIRWHLLDTPKDNSQDSLPSETATTRIRLLISNLDPVCLALTGHPGNLISSSSFIRGRSLRGAIAAACIAIGRAEWAHEILTDTLSWGDALPLPASELANGRLADYDVLPIPLSVGTPKATAIRTDLPWWTSQSIESTFGSRGEIDQIRLNDGERPTEKLKRPKDGEFLFRQRVDTPWQLYTPQILHRLHTRVPSKENNHEQALFSTEEIAENTLFVSDVIVLDNGKARLIMDVLNTLNRQWLRLGRGGKPLMIKSAASLPVTGHGPAMGKSFTLLLESDLISRDCYGNFHDRLEAATIAELAGLSEADVTTLSSYSEGCEIFGFNASTGLPRLAQHAIKAGSVIHIGGPDAPRLREALTRRYALGDCPEEGFGRFRLDALPVPQSWQPAETGGKHRTPLREETLCQEARKWVNQFGKTLDSPSNSQWGDFRGRIQAAQSHHDIIRLFNFLTDASEKHGGKPWNGFTKNQHYLSFRKRIEDMPLPDAQMLLEFFVRWRQALKQPSLKEHA